MKIIRKHWREIISLVISILFSAIIEAQFHLNWLLMFFVVLGLFLLISLKGPELVTALRGRFRSLSKEEDDFFDNFDGEVEVSGLERGISKIDFVIYFDAPSGSTFQVQMWLPYLKMLNRPYLFVVRGSKNFRELRLLGLPVVRAESQIDLAIVEKLNAAAVFYVNNSMRNSHMLRYNSLTHIQLLHGESDKAPSYNPNSAAFDFVFVAGQAGIDRYRKNDVYVSAEKFRIVSRPQNASVIVANEVSKANPKVIFYATTWSGYSEDTELTSIHFAEKIVTHLLESGHSVIFRPHPYNFKNAAQKKIINSISNILQKSNEETGRASCISGHPSTQSPFPKMVDCINAADVMISDVSSVQADWLFSAKPYITIDTKNQRDTFAVQNPITEGGYYINATLDDFDSAITAACGDDPLRAPRIKLRKHVLGVELDEDPVALFTEAALDVIDNFDKVAHTRDKYEKRRTAGS